MIRKPICAAVFALCACHSPPSIVQQSKLEGVASVIDGDTIEIHGQRIRLSGFDTPESGKSCGTFNAYQKASIALSQFIGSETVSCETEGNKDQYGRLVATCSVRGIDMGYYMVSQGWGRDWPQYSKGKYSAKEKEARADKRGIWGWSCPADLWSGRKYD